jgi:hypothetical protein
MIKKKFLIFTCLMVAIFIFTPNLSDTYAQAGQDQEVKAAEGSSSKGSSTDSNISEDETPNSKSKKPEPPASKGGTSKGSSSGCEVQLDNWTPWKVKIYVDGKYQGTMMPYGESYTYATPGRVKVYARADFDDGSYLYWGPRNYSCNSNQYVYFKMTE